MKEDSRMDIEEIRSLALKHILWSFSAINLMYGSDFAGVNFFLETSRSYTSSTDHKRVL